MPESETFADKNVSARYIVKNVLTKKQQPKTKTKPKQFNTFNTRKVTT